MIEKLVVIGGCAAGMSAASAARRIDPDLEIIVFESSHFVSYGSCGLPYFISGVVKSHKDLIVYTPEFFRDKRNIQVHIRHRVESIDPNGKRVRVCNLERGESFEESFDRLVIATGGSPALPSIKGADLDHVFTIRRIEDGLAIRDFIEHSSPSEAVIIGGGYIGVEMAEALRKVGLDVTIVERLPYLLRLDEEISKIVEGELSRNGVSVLRETEVEEIRLRGVITSSDNLPAGMVMLCLGVKPNVELARTARINIGSTGAIEVDRRLRTSHPSIFAAGDCVQVRNLLTNRPDYIPLGTAANKQGRVAGTNAAGGDASFEGVLGTSVTKVFDLEVARTGLTERKAREVGFLPVSSLITADSRARYYPDGSKITVKLVVDRRDRRVIGAQMIGGEGVAKRIDVIATAIQAGMTVDQLYNLDLSYAPPFAPVWDPILIAARSAIKELGKKP
ncbi:TPA: NADH oxidase [Candidatus Poribacteria bacterium]|nr:NADH oxidase [Candidatus Poribacteria bacterium]